MNTLEGNKLIAEFMGIVYTMLYITNFIRIFNEN